MFSVELVGKSELIAHLDQMPATVVAVLQTKVQGLAIKLQGHIVRDKLHGQVLHQRSGALARSIQEVVQTSGTGVEAKVFSAGDVKYAAIQEFGGVTPPHDIFPSKAGALAFMMGGRQVFAAVVHHPGSHIPERSFMRSSLGDMAAEIETGLKSAVVEGMQKALGHAA